MRAARVDKLVLAGGTMWVTVLAFGPLADILDGRRHKIEIPPSSSVRYLLEEMGIDEWIDRSISISINDTIVKDDHPLTDGDEIALLPPVSGG